MWVTFCQFTKAFNSWGNSSTAKSELLAWVMCITWRILLKLSANPGDTPVYTRNRSNTASFNPTALSHTSDKSDTVERTSIQSLKEFSCCCELQELWEKRKRCQKPKCSRYMKSAQKTQHRPWPGVKSTEHNVLKTSTETAIMTPASSRFHWAQYPSTRVTGFRSCLWPKLSKLVTMGIQFISWMFLHCLGFALHFLNESIVQPESHL